MFLVRGTLGPSQAGLPVDILILRTCPARSLEPPKL